MVHDSCDFCNNIIIMITLHCPKTLNSKLFVLFIMIYTISEITVLVI